MNILRFFLFALIALAVAACTQIMRNGGEDALPPAASASLRLATYNAHYIILHDESSSWSIPDWERRKGPMDAAFKTVNADIMAFQEMESFGRGMGRDTNLALDWLRAQNPDYGVAAVGDPSVFPSTQPIFYRRDRLRQTDQGWFFFSDTPDVIYSRTYDGGWSAFATWATFQDRTTAASFRVVNIHTDYSSKSNRLKSAQLVAQRIAPWVNAGENVFVVGDFNARRGDETLTIIEGAGVTFPPIKGSTYHFNRGLNLFGAIDHLGHAGRITLESEPVVVRQKFDGEWPTDHYPVVADFKIAP